MEQSPVEAAPRKHKGWPLGKPRKPCIEAVLAQPQAPVFVRVRMKGMEPFDIECSQHFVENGFHVFVYPSLRDRFRQTRREIAISEVIDIEITGTFDLTRQPVLPAQPPRILPAAESPLRGDGRPVIHSAKENIMRMLREQQEAAEQSGSVKIREIPEIDRVKVSLGGSDG